MTLSRAAGGKRWSRIIVRPSQTRLASGSIFPRGCRLDAAGPQHRSGFGRGGRTTDVARRFGVSLARISQLRRELERSWLAFHGEEAEREQMELLARGLAIERRLSRLANHANSNSKGEPNRPERASRVPTANGVRRWAGSIEGRLRGEESEPELELRTEGKHGTACRPGHRRHPYGRDLQMGQTDRGSKGIRRRPCTRPEPDQSNVTTDVMRSRLWAARSWIFLDIRQSGWADTRSVSDACLLMTIKARDAGSL